MAIQKEVVLSQLDPSGSLKCPAAIHVIDDVGMNDRERVATVVLTAYASAEARAARAVLTQTQLQVRGEEYAAIEKITPQQLGLTATATVREFTKRLGYQLVKAKLPGMADGIEV